MYYRRYCKILAKVIKEAKKVYYDNVLLKPKNKIKTTWSIIKRETGYKNHKKELQALKINKIIIKGKGHITKAFNEYFSSIAQTIIEDLNKDNNESLTHYII
jgi:superoxide dismutase